VKYGVQFDDVTYSNINQRTGPTFTAPDGRVTATGATIDIIADPTFGKVYRVTRANFNSARTTTQKYVTVFAQDSWRLDRLTINPGIRYEQEKMAGSIITDFQLKNNWAPRLGATYDLTGRRQDEGVRATSAFSIRVFRTTWRRGRSRPMTARRAPTTSTPT
jgi:hypothetical protein